MESNVQKRLTELAPRLGEQSQKLIQYLQRSGAGLANQPITVVASEAGCSTATVSRLAHQLGYANFSELRWALIQDQVQPPTTTRIQPADAPMVVAKKTLAANVATLNGTFLQMNDHDLRTALKLIVHSQRLGFFGMGGSNIVALDAYHKFLRVPLNLVHNSEYHLALMEAARFTPKDCALVISHTGDDTDTLVIAETLRHHHVPMIVMTSFPNAPLVPFGDVVFYSISADSQNRSEALLSLTSQLAINDCLYMLTAQYFGPAADDVLNQMHQTIFKKHPHHAQQPEALD